MKQFLLAVSLLFSFVQFAQEIPSPSSFLGYELGSQFTRHHEVMDYYQNLAKIASNKVQLIEYGKTNERRPLVLAYVSSPTNLTNLETIRAAHLESLSGKSDSGKAIVWLSYNVHGNESVGTEAAMQTIYELLTSKKELLENTVVIIDPCVNPDGRERYINWYYQFKNAPHQLDPNSKEHHEPWLRGRSNHYMFDLNRDWAWLTQIESQHRIKKYNEWMPHVHADFHEQGVDNPYYFPPAAQPYHEVITDFQKDFQVTVGKNHAKYFDANGWFYFTKERFDLLYPSYGDTYPTYNGAIGMTYEQGGSGRAGLGVLTGIGDTLTLSDRIAHHHTTGISTVEVASKNATKLNSEFKKYHQNRSYKYKSYVLNGNRDKIKMLEALLNKHQIRYGRGQNGTVKGYRYATAATGSMKTSEQSLIVSIDQPKAALVKVLFEPKVKLTDSVTYDITAWSLPYAYGLDAVASSTAISTSGSKPANAQPTTVNNDSYAYITDWNSMDDARFLSDLLQQKVRVRKVNHPFSTEGRSFDRGSLIVTKADNEKLDNWMDIVKGAAAKHSKELFPVQTGFVDSGKDFGSDHVKMIRKPKVAVLSGYPTSTLRFGEVWHFFEQQLGYPLSIIDGSYFDRVDLESYTILVLPNGSYGKYLTESRLKRIKTWVQKGGKLIVMGNALKSIATDKGFGIKLRKAKKDTTNTVSKSFKNTQREGIKKAITGAIFKSKVDNSHPLAFGYGDHYFSLKLGSDAYEYLKSGNVAYLEEGTKPVSGFAGSEAQKKIGKSLIFGAEKQGKGNVIYMVDNPLFRGFWENGKLFFANALFMVD